CLKLHFSFCPLSFRNRINRDASSRVEGTMRRRDFHAAYVDEQFDIVVDVNRAEVAGVKLPVMRLVLSEKTERSIEWHSADRGSRMKQVKHHRSDLRKVRRPNVDSKLRF